MLKAAKTVLKLITFSRLNELINAVELLKRQQALDVRGDVFNSMNKAKFSNPSGNQASSSFGKITSASDGRVMQVSLRIEF